MVYYNIETEEWGISFLDVRLALPNTSIPVGTEEVGPFRLITPLAPVTHDPSIEGIREIKPKLQGQSWVQQWEVYALTTEEVQAIAMQTALGRKAEVQSELQRILDEFVATRDYDNIVSACSYATSKKPRFKADGEYCVDLRDAFWDISSGVMAEYLAGTRPLPTVAEIVALLPVPEWPADPT